MTIKKPSVSQLLSLLDKPALLNWANKIGLEGKTLLDIRRQNMSAGTNLHKQVERWLINKTPIENAAYQESVVNFFSDNTIMEVEKQIEHDKFCGRIDVKYQTANGDVYICDFKTNQSRVYRENKLQLAAYRMSEGCDKVAIISIPEMKIIECNITDFAPYEKTILCLSELYKLNEIIQSDKQ